MEIESDGNMRRPMAEIPSSVLGQSSNVMQSETLGYVPPILPLSATTRVCNFLYWIFSVLYGFVCFGNKNYSKLKRKSSSLDVHRSD